MGEHDDGGLAHAGYADDPAGGGGELGAAVHVPNNVDADYGSEDVGREILRDFECDGHDHGDVEWEHEYVCRVPRNVARGFRHCGVARDHDGGDVVDASVLE